MDSHEAIDIWDALGITIFSMLGGYDHLTARESILELSASQYLHVKDVLKSPPDLDLEPSTN